jgi:hypothetical protein
LKAKSSCIYEGANDPDGKILAEIVGRPLLAAAGSTSNTMAQFIPQYFGSGNKWSKVHMVGSACWMERPED